MVNKTASSPRVTRKRQARTAHILDTALACMSTSGVEGLSMHQVAGSLDLTVGALYRYFDSKGALIAALEARVINEYAEDLSEMVLAPRPAPAAATDPVAALVSILELVLAYGHLCRVKPVHMQLLNGILASPAHLLPPEEAEKIMVDLVSVFEPFEMLFAKAEAVGALSQGDANARLLIFWNAARGILQLAKLSAFDAKRFDNDHLFKETANALLMGWGARSTDLNEAWAVARRYEGDSP